jgi:hypothetical protein
MNTINEKLETALKDTKNALKVEKNLVTALREELSKTREQFSTNRLAHARRQVELEESKGLMSVLKGRAEKAEKDAEKLRTYSKTVEKARVDLEMKLSRMREDLQVIRGGVDGMNEMRGDSTNNGNLSSDGRKSALHYFCAAAKNKKELSRLVEHKFAKFYCTVCESNLKDVVITSCYHTFCQSCVDKNLKTRHRKCALCNLPFGKNDVHKLY